ncbi:MAG: Holliday junction branch migration protein RuvA [Lachnospiraceae bacterium]|nr:Holliday junction branch migration protein RuvA [Lachnospiraceae bacterium]
MIRYLCGILTEVAEAEIVVEVQGIGYAVNVPVSMMERLPDLGENIKVYTYFSVREDAMQLFGFLNREDLQMYRLLISVNGIGPKAGLGIMGTLTGEDLRYAVMSEDAKTIAKAPGIGPKTAKKVILELKDKIDLAGMVADAEVEDSAGTAGSAEMAGTGNQAVVRDAIEALVVLGYPKTDAARAVRSVELSEDVTVEELLKKSLKNI